MVKLKDIPFLKKMVDLAYAILIVVLISAIVGLIFAFPVMWLWNYVFGGINAQLQINVLQAWALNVLTGILFGRSERK